MLCSSSASLETQDLGKLITEIYCDYPVNVSNLSSSKFAHFRRCDMIERPEIASSCRQSCIRSTHLHFSSKMSQSDSSVRFLGRTSLRTLDEAEEADDEYELAFSDPSEFAEAHRSFILFRSKSATKEEEKESKRGDDPDEILAAPPLLPPPSTSIVAPSGWDPLPSPPQAGMLKCFMQFSVSAPQTHPLIALISAPPLGN